MTKIRPRTGQDGAGRGIEAPIAVSPHPPSEEEAPGPGSAEYARCIQRLANLLDATTQRTVIGVSKGGGSARS